MAIVLKSGPLEPHMHLAIGVLQKLQPANRPRTSDKLYRLLKSRSCFRFGFRVPLPCLLEAMAAPLEESGAPSELQAMVAELQASAKLAPQEKGEQLLIWCRDLAKLTTQANNDAAAANQAREGQGEFIRLRQKLREQLDAASRQKGEVSAQLEELRSRRFEAAQQRTELKRQIALLKNSVGFETVAELDRLISDLELSLTQGSMSLKAEKACLVQISTLQKSRREKLPTLLSLQESLAKIREPDLEENQAANAKYSEVAAKLKNTRADLAKLIQSRGLACKAILKNVEQHKRLQVLKDRIDRGRQNAAENDGLLDLESFTRFTSMVAKAVTSQLLQNPPSIRDDRKKLDFSRWLCPKTFSTISTDAKMLVHELQARGFLSLSSDDCLSYDDRKINTFTVSHVSSPQMPNARLWLLGLPSSKSCVHTARDPLLSKNDLDHLKSLLRCDLLVNYASGFTEIKTRAETVLPLDVVKDVISIVLGKDPVFYCKGFIRTESHGLAIGKGGINMLQLEKSHQAKLLLREDGPGESRLAGWMATSRLLAWGSHVWSDPEALKDKLHELWSLGEQLATKIPAAAIKAGLPIEGFADEDLSMPCAIFPVRFPELQGELYTLRPRLRCGLRLDRGVGEKSATVHVSILRETELSSPQLRKAISLVFGAQPAFTCGASFSKVSAGHLIGRGGAHIQMLERAHNVRLIMKADGENYFLHGWLRVAGLPQTDLSGNLENYVLDLSKAVTNDALAKLHQVESYEKRTESDRHESGSKGGGRPQLARSFSNEYAAARTLRIQERAKAREKHERRKEHLVAKHERLHTKRGRKKERDKGPSIHGGRHKEHGVYMKDMNDMLPPEEASFSIPIEEEHGEEQESDEGDIMSLVRRKQLGRASWQDLDQISPGSRELIQSAPSGSS